MPAPYRSFWEVEMPKYTKEELEGPPEPYKPPFKVTSKTYKVVEFEFNGQRIKATVGGDNNVEMLLMPSPYTSRDMAVFTHEELDGFISFLQGLSKT